MDLECAECEYTILLVGNMSVYSRRSWIPVVHESGLKLELELDGDVLSSPPIATSTNELIDQSRFNYTNSLHRSAAVPHR